MMSNPKKVTAVLKVTTTQSFWNEAADEETVRSFIEEVFDDGAIEAEVELLEEHEPVEPKRHGISMYCGRCGQKLVYGRYNKASFCWKCGLEVKWE